MLIFNIEFNKKVNKSVWWMPWLSEAMKDVVSCDKLRGGASNLRSEDFRMRKLIQGNACISLHEYIVQ